MKKERDTKSFTFTYLIFINVTIVIFLTSLSVSTPIPPYNVYNYDLTTPQFTPDGRLKQVEYASSAPLHSSPMIIVAIPSIISHRYLKLSSLYNHTLRKDEGENEIELINKEDCVALILATLTFHSPGFTINTPSKELDYGRRGQSRIVDIPVSRQCAFNYSIPDFSTMSLPLQAFGSKIVLGLSGILSDNIALVKVAYETLRNWQEAYGLCSNHVHSHISCQKHNSNTGLNTIKAISSCRVAETVARAIAFKFQERCFGGGLRPFGASIAVCGIDLNEIVLVITTPSGSMKYYNIDKKMNHIQPSVWIFGSDNSDGMEESLRETILKRIYGEAGQKAISGREHKLEKNKGIVRRTMESVLKALLKMHKLNDNEGDSEVNTNRKKYHGVFPQQVDMVLITSTGGVQRLEDKKIQDLLQSI